MRKFRNWKSEENRDDLKIEKVGEDGENLEIKKSRSKSKKFWNRKSEENEDNLEIEKVGENLENFETEKVEETPKI